VFLFGRRRLSLAGVFGDWSSEAYKSYLEFALPAKLRVARAVSHALTHPG